MGLAAEPHSTGNNDAVVDRFVDQPLQLLLGGLDALQVLLQQLVVDLDNVLHKLDVAVGRGVDHLVGDGSSRRLAAAVVEGAVAHEVGDAVERGLLAEGQLHRLHVAAEVRLQVVQGPLERGALPVEAVDEHHAGQAQPVGVAPQDLVLGLHTGHGVHHKHRQVGRVHAVDGLADEVRVARRVDEIDPVVAPVEGRHGQAQALTAGLLLGVMVAVGGAVVDAAHPAQHAGPVKHRLGQGGLAVAVVADEDDVSDGLRRHADCSSLWVGCGSEGRRH